MSIRNSAITVRKFSNLRGNFLWNAIEMSETLSEIFKVSLVVELVGKES